MLLCAEQQSTPTPTIFVKVVKHSFLEGMYGAIDGDVRRDVIDHKKDS
jgi:hypothetical protein